MPQTVPYRNPHCDHRPPLSPEMMPPNGSSEVSMPLDGLGLLPTLAGVYKGPKGPSPEFALPHQPQSNPMLIPESSPHPSKLSHSHSDQSCLFYSKNKTGQRCAAELAQRTHSLARKALLAGVRDPSAPGVMIRCELEQLCPNSGRFL